MLYFEILTLIITDLSWLTKIGTSHGVSLRLHSQVCSVETGHGLSLHTLPDNFDNALNVIGHDYVFPFNSCKMFGYFVPEYFDLFANDRMERYFSFDFSGETNPVMGTYSNIIP